MKNSYSNIYTFNKKILSKTIKSLKNAGVVGLPTETVYGLGGNAYSRISVKKIFKLKGRPKFNPLIIHYYNIKRAAGDVIFNKNLIKLYKKLCPGPITFVLKKSPSSKITSIACAKLDTVAIRFPKHKVIKNLLKNIDFPLAMPSANISTNVSPTKARDVYDEFKRKLKLIIDGGECEIGIESTVIDLTSKPRILRPGLISKDFIKKILQKNVKISFKNKKIQSPGMMKKHYSPGIPIKINQKKHDGRSAFIYIGKKYENKKDYFSLSKNQNLNEAASNLYKILRLIKKKGYKKIQISKIPNFGTGIAINDRLKRAANFK